MRLSQAKTWLAVLILGLVAASVWSLRGDNRSSETLLEEARLSLRKRDNATAIQLAHVLLGRSGHEAEGNFLLGKAHSNDYDPAVAIACFEQIPDDHPEFGLPARISGGELILFRQNRLNAAREHFERALRLSPHHGQVHERLSYIDGVAGLSYRALPHRMALICQDQYGPVHVMLLALGPNHEEQAELIRRCFQADPTDPFARCGMASLAIREGRGADALEFLDGLRKDHPDWPEPQAWCGALLLAREPDSERLHAWEAALPASIATHPEVWFVRGSIARHRGDLPGAARCFAEAVRIDPNYQAANFQLARVLLELGEPERASPFLRRANLLEELVVTVKSWQITEDKTEIAKRAARVTSELGLLWEAEGWQRGVESPAKRVERPSPPTFPSTASGLERAVVVEQTLAAYRAARQVEPFKGFVGWAPSDYPLPKGEPRPATPATSAAPVTAIRFENDAARAGSASAYRNGGRLETKSEYMYESTGGGVGVLDYDLDGWPDLCFTQGCDWPPPSGPRASPKSRDLDRLYHNAGGQSFEDVTLAANLLDDRFGQGVAVGDIDCDGFPDVCIANIGANRLFRNNGDGSFTDVTEQTGIAGNAWSTSCAIADLNGDGFPEIYVVNYVEGAGMFDRPCLLPDGSKRVCTPNEFNAMHDVLYFNLGDGGFRDISASAGIHAPDGKGLGIVAADFDDSGRIGLFVANDTTPNFFFRNRTEHPGDDPKLEEQAFLAGVAVDAEGRSQACMGVACGDANGDGRLDLFATNFLNEPNVLYLQQPGGIFSDETRAARLYEPSLLQLGFGTQVLDADLDGALDLIVTNGHIGDLSRSGVPYRMPTQFFRNAGNARFDEVPATQLGEFFPIKHLGRGLARLDWNRDGKDDVAVSHLEENVALLTNRTATRHHTFVLRLRGVESSRDAIGSRVQVTSGSRTQTAQVTAGDGYQASNERRLTFGLGPETTVAKLEVRWLSGRVQTFENLAADTEWVLIEGAAAPLPLSR